MTRLFAITGLLFGFAGCQTIQDDIDDCTTCIHQRFEAHMAWCENKSCYSDVDHCCHFRKGFVAGYQDVANGGNGCPPEIPPRCYWKPCNQNMVGKQKAAAWFDGFSHGALAAEQDGVKERGKIYISPYVREECDKTGCEDDVFEIPPRGEGGIGEPEPLPLIPPAPGADPNGTDPKDPKSVKPPYVKPNPKKNN